MAKKNQTIKQVRNVDQANETLAEIAAVKRHIKAIESEMNEIIDKAKSEAEIKAASHQVKLAALEGGLTAYATGAKAELFPQRRSVELDFGRIGFRKSVEIKAIPKWNWAKVMERARELGLMAAIRIKESINKEELHEWPDEKLAAIGARRVENDNFFYEVDEEKLAEVSRG